MTSQGSAYTRFRLALDSGNATVAYATATELDFVSLPDALELVLRLTTRLVTDSAWVDDARRGASRAPPRSDSNRSVRALAGKKRAEVDSLSIEE